MPQNLYHERITQTHPIVQAKARDFLARATAAGYRIMVVRGWDSTEAQWLKFQQGREMDRTDGTWRVVDPQKVVTDALPGQSGHNLIFEATREPGSTAIDIVPLDRQERPLWELPGESEAQLEIRWNQAVGRSVAAGWADLYRLASKSGLDAYGDDWGAVMKKDRGHLEEPAYRLILKELGLVQPVWTLPTIA